MEPTDLIVLSPPGPIDPSLAIAACRAGARGALDLEFAPDRPAAVAAVARLARFAPGPYGVRVGPANAPVLRDLLGVDIVRPSWVILACGSHPDLGRWVGKFRRHGVEVLIEAATPAEAVRGAELGADGVILKGHEAGGRVGPDTTFVLV